MNIYISGSNRKQNCYHILEDIKGEEDKLISLADKHIEYCLGCNCCINNLKKYCKIEDDMQEIYEDMLKADNIIIATPIYMNHIPGILKNVIDRLNPFCCHELLKGKKIYLITVGQLSEEENKEVAEGIEKYFQELSEFFYFDFVYLKNLSSGDIKQIDDIKRNYSNYGEIVKEIKNSYFFS